MVTSASTHKYSENSHASMARNENSLRLCCLATSGKMLSQSSETGCHHQVDQLVLLPLTDYVLYCGGMEAGYAGSLGGSPLCGLYRDVPLDRVWFLASLP